VGFAIGLDRVVLLHELAQANVEPEAEDRSADVYLCVTQPECSGAALVVANALRAALPRLRVRQHLGGGNLKKQLKKADACGAVVAILIDDESLDQQTLTIKHLRDASLGQETVTFEAGIARLQQH
jgi:histidyl-tRNA synthetase